MSMGFRPDIVVTSADGSGVSLVAEVKLALPNRSKTELQLKQYMAGMRCPVGVLATPDRLWIYNDTYSDKGLDSIESVGEFPYTWSRGGVDSPSRDPAMFEQEFQSWLERLSEEPERVSLPAQLRDAVETYVVPMLARGQVRAGRPRSGSAAGR
ncbi:MAG TPA: hypothetical protein VK447_04455 [Myxococcaceae bacterium]|nr:hypothetical protein [Myxococcaceae bacterium]